MSTTVGVDGLEVTGPTEDRFDEVPTPRALELVAPSAASSTAAGSSGSPRGRGGSARCSPGWPCRTSAATS